MRRKEIEFPAYDGIGMSDRHGHRVNINIIIIYNDDFMREKKHSLQSLYAYTS